MVWSAVLTLAGLCNYLWHLNGSLGWLYHAINAGLVITGFAIIGLLCNWFLSKDILTIKDESLQIEKIRLFNHSKKHYQNHKISGLQFNGDDPRSANPIYRLIAEKLDLRPYYLFSNLFEQAERIYFYYNGQPVYFGLNIDEIQTKELVMFIKMYANLPVNPLLLKRIALDYEPSYLN